MGIAAMPTVITSSALGGRGRPPASERIVMGIIGAGGQGTQGMAGGIWAPEGGFIGQSRVQFVAVCDVNAHRRSQARDLVNQRYGNQDCAAYGDFRDLLARDDIDAVLIATGDRWHTLCSIYAAKAGKDIYCEKPISVTIEEAKALRAAIRRYGRVFQMGTQQRSSWAFRFASELVRNGYIGDVKRVSVAVGEGAAHRECHLPAQPVPDYLDYDMWLGPVPWRPYHPDYVGGWMAYRDLSGGEMTNWGAHHFDIAQWGLGMDDGGPVEILPPNGKDIPTLTFRYAQGTEVVRDPDRMHVLTGQGNGLVFEGTEGDVGVWRHEVKTRPENLVRHRIGPNEIHLHKYDNHHDDFLDAVKTRGRTGSNAEIGARSITVCHLGNIAYELGRPLRWDPESEDFVKDEEASRMLSRPMRSPWTL